MPLSAVQCELPVPMWARRAMSEAGAKIAPNVEVMLASYAAEEAPVVFEVVFPDVGTGQKIDPHYQKIARLLPAPEARDPVAIRSLNGMFFAPFAPATGDDPYTIRTGRGRKHELASLLGLWQLPAVSALNPFLELPLQPVGPSHEVEVTELLIGSSIAERMTSRAQERAALINGIVHIAVHEPVWRFDSVPNDEAGGRRPVARICIPLAEAFEARLRVGFDRRDEVAAFFPQLLRSRRAAVEVEFTGEATLRAARPLSRDDQRLVALDVAGTMLAETRSEAPRLGRPALLARAALAFLDTGATALDRFALCDRFAAELDTTDPKLGHALRAHKLSVLRRRIWAELGERCT